MKWKSKDSIPRDSRWILITSTDGDYYVVRYNPKNNKDFPWEPSSCEAGELAEKFVNLWTNITPPK